MKASTKKLLEKLDTGAPADDGGGFLGVDIPLEDAGLVLLSVPWDVTTSYGKGTAEGPAAIIQASHQLDVFDLAFGKPFMVGLNMLPPDEKIAELNKSVAEQSVHKVNQASEKVNQRVYELAIELMRQGKQVGLVGGDHSSPFGYIKALAERQIDGFGILHFDAHFDLREHYEGYEHSHASIMHNVVTHLPHIRRLVQVGIRDFSLPEKRFAESLGERSQVFYGRVLFNLKANSVSFHDVTNEIISSLPQNVYVSFDIDALDPALCPSTGTPVPGGLSFDESLYILEMLVSSGRKIIGFDLCEVAPGPEGDEWNANVGARILYKLCGAMLRSQRLC